MLTEKKECLDNKCFTREAKSMPFSVCANRFPINHDAYNDMGKHIATEKPILLSKFPVEDGRGQGDIVSTIIKTEDLFQGCHWAQQAKRPPGWLGKFMMKVVTD